MKKNATVRHVSVIIPALNERKWIGQAIHTVRTDPAVREVIVADGGSSDGTRELAADAGARVIRHDLPIDAGGGRGGQIQAGIASATGDVVAIVHADTVISRPAFSMMLQVLRRNPDVVGGAYGCRFDSEDFRFRFIEWANAARVRLTGIAFGDQVQFFRREPVARCNLFPGIPLMEDVEFSLRLKRTGRTIYLSGDARVSPRCWSRRGFSHSLTVIHLFSVYMIRRIWKTPDVAAMYRQYYGGSP